MPRLSAEPQRLHLSAGTGEAVGGDDDICTVFVFDSHILKCALLQFVYLLVVVFCLEGSASGSAYFYSRKVHRKSNCTRLKILDH